MGQRPNSSCRYDLAATRSIPATRDFIFFFIFFLQEDEKRQAVPGKITGLSLGNGDRAGS